MRLNRERHHNILKAEVGRFKRLGRSGDHK